MNRRIQVFGLIYILLTIIGLFLPANSPLACSSYYIREHAIIIVLLLWLKKSLYSSINKIIVDLLVVYKFELIFYNLILIFVNKSQYDFIENWYNISLALTGAIWLVIFLFVGIKLNKFR